MKVLFAFLTVVLLCPCVFAQGAAGNPATRNGGSGGPSPFASAFKTLEGVVIKTDTNRKAIQVRLNRGDKVEGFALDEKCKIKADKKEFDKKELKLEELQAGYVVEMKLRVKDGMITEIKVKKPKESGDKGAAPASTAEKN